MVVMQLSAHAHGPAGHQIPKPDTTGHMDERGRNMTHADEQFDTRIEVMTTKAMKEGARRLARLRGNKPSAMIRDMLAAELTRAFGDTWHEFGSAEELTDDSQ